MSTRCAVPRDRAPLPALVALIAACVLAASAGAAERPPVVFIPGIIGSLLASRPDPDPRLNVVLWPPLYPNAPRRPDDIVKVNDAFVRLSLNPRPETTDHPLARPPFDENIVALDVIRSYGGEQFYGPVLDYLKEKGRYVEYDVAGDPARRTAAGCVAARQQPRPSLFVFAYDWRLAIEDNAVKLADYVRCVSAVHPGQKIDIVTHSMGGLVARRYIIDNPGTVNKLITVAAPFLGSAKPLYQMIYGLLDTDLSMKGLLKEYLFGPTVRNMLLYYPGLHELMLSRQYFELGGPRYTITDFSRKEQLSYDELMALIDRMLPDKSYNGKTAAQTNRDFHDYTANGNSQDDWSRDTTGVRYFHLFGVQRSEDTPHSLRQQEGERLGEDDRPIAGYHLDPKGAGDGTVPRLSAERIARGRNLNAPNAQTFVFNTSPDPLLEHAGIMTNPDVLAKVLALLGEDADQPIHKVRVTLGSPR